MFNSHADYIFPFDAIFYWLKHIFIWSFQTGATNMDGLIRLPGRLIYLIVFQLFGNVGISYIFLFTSLAIIFFAAYYFARRFLNISNRSTAIILSLFFTLNPIFLGNIAKLGLIVAAAMLPLCLAFLFQAFAKKRFSYFILYLLALNLSLIHPFTFTVNLIASGSYALYLLSKNQDFARLNIWKFISLFIVALLMNLYFILPLLSLGTVDKTALSQDISDRPVDYTSLVEVANTNDIFTALSLSKNIFVDFVFYDDSSYLVYFVPIFLLYVVLITFYLLVSKKLKQTDKCQFFIWMTVFLALTAISTATFFNIDILIKFLISLPGGWMFRSPLKWQLYIPIALIVLLAIIMRHLTKKQLLAANISLVAIIILANVTLVFDITKKLLTPRTIVYFSALQDTNMGGKNLLVVKSNDCMSFANERPEVITELNQVLISKNTQVKNISINDIDKINIGDFDYLLSCKIKDSQLEPHLFESKLTHQFAANSFSLYKNPAPRAHIYTTDKIYEIDRRGSINNKASFIKESAKENFDFVSSEKRVKPLTGLQDMFEGISSGNIQNKTIIAKSSSKITPKQELVIRQTKYPLYYSQSNDDKHVSFSPTPLDGFALLESSNGFSRLDVDRPSRDSVKVSYIDKQYSYANTLPNPSFESGAWQSRVGDCNAYDDKPEISMKPNPEEKTDGRQSLQLSAARHTACVGIRQNKAAQAEKTYALSFDYKSSGANMAGYNVSFGENASPINERLAEQGDDWHAFSSIIKVPNNATELKLTIYAYPNEVAKKTAVVSYDNFKFIEIPAIQDSFYIISPPSQPLSPPDNIKYTNIDPTKKYIELRSAKEPFYLAMKDSFHPKWQLSLFDDNKGLANSMAFSTDGIVESKNHFQLNNTINGWYVDPAELCKENNAGCKKNSDGSYDIELMAEFTPQRWFYLGAVISGVTFIVCLIYLFYDWRKHRWSKIALGNKFKL